MKQLTLLGTGVLALLLGCANGGGDIVGTGGHSSSNDGGDSGDGGNPMHGNGGSTSVTDPTTNNTVTNTTTGTQTTTTSSMNTSTTTGAGCTGNQFDCGNGQCLPAQQECDSTVQCANGADESPNDSNCSTTTTGSASTGASMGGCGMFELPCNDGNGCYLIFFACDGSPDCADASDEDPALCGGGSAPPGWTCDPSFFGAGDGCDCGCGVVDSDCADATIGSCTYCDEGCSIDTCPGTINPNDNSQCQ